MAGYFSIERDLLSHHLWTDEPFSRGQAWIDLIGLANFTDGWIRVAGERIEIRRGQCGWSELRLSERWKWSRNKVRRFLNELFLDGRITRNTNNRTTVLTICNYAAYQSHDTTDETPDETTERHQAKQQTDTKEEGKEERKKDKNRGTRFALADPPAEWTQFCLTQRPDLDPGITFDKFRDHWIAQPGSRGLKTDWTATWRNWVRREPAKGTNYGKSAHTPSKADRAKSAVIDGLADAGIKV
jgi:hypothetical protein